MKAAVLIALALAIGAMGVYVAEVDDAPGGAVIASLLMFGGILLGLMTARRQLPAWAVRTALGLGVLISIFLGFITHAIAVAAPLFAQPADVPSVSASAPAPERAAAVDRARALVRAAVVDQNLPGVSIAVGKDNGIVWAEGFGWRDIVTKTGVTPQTRFNIGSAASVVGAAPIASLGMTNTGTDKSSDWSPGHIGEPEDDFPPFTFIHDVIMRPIGIADPAKPLPDERATHYVPRSDDNNPRRGRRLMYMRDLACCADGKAAFYSTPSDLVRFGLATKTEALTAQLAGGNVMSLVTRRDDGTVVVVASNIAYAKTDVLAQRVAEVFAGIR